MPTSSVSCEPTFVRPNSLIRRLPHSLGLLACATFFLSSSLNAQDRNEQSWRGRIGPDQLVLSRLQYEGNTFGSSETYPLIFADPNISGVQASIHLDSYLVVPGLPRIGSLQLSGITSSFSSKSEGALSLSPNKKILTYIGYDASVGSEGVSNSYTPAANLAGNTAPLYNRSVAIIGADGVLSVTPEANAYSGDNPRAAITTNGNQFYMAGNSDSTIASDGTGPGTTIGARIGTVGSPVSQQLGVYFAADRPDESAKKHIKDSNFRGIGIFDDNLFVSKGSGGNGDNGVFQVHNGTGNGLPTGTENTITELLGSPATDPVTGMPSPYTSFGFWFANATTLYIADEGYPNTDTNGSLIADPLAGLEKWSLVNGKWSLDYTIQNGLHLLKSTAVEGYPVPTFTYGIRNIAGKHNGDGTVTIYAITAQYSSISGGEPDPTRLVAVRDEVKNHSLPAARNSSDSDWDDWFRAPLDQFVTLKRSKAGEVLRGVALAPEDRDHTRR